MQGWGGLSKEARADLVLFCVTIIWGMGFVAQKLGAGFLGPWQYNGLRFLLAGICVALFYRSRLVCLKSPSLRRRGSKLGLIALGGAYLQQLGLAHTSATHAGFLTCTYVIFVPLFFSLLGRPVARVIWLSAGIAITGAFLLSVGADASISVGDLLVLLSAAVWGIAFLYIEKIVALEDPIGLAFVQFSVVGLLSLCIGIFFEPWDPLAIREAWWPIVFGGMISVGVGYTAHLVAQRHTPPTHAAIICSLESVFASLFGVLCLGESLDARGIAGAILIMASALLTQLRGTREVSVLPNHII